VAETYQDGHPTRTPGTLDLRERSSVSQDLLGQMRSEAQVASALGVTVHTLRCWRTAGKGPDYVKVGRKVVYLEPMLNQWVMSKFSVLGDRNGKDERPVGTESQ
jgi:hypothetical protein